MKIIRRKKHCLAGQAAGIRRTAPSGNTLADELCDPGFVEEAAIGQFCVTSRSGSACNAPPCAACAPECTTWKR
eukprot:4809233-Pyramimonas_sp.AAC.1